MSRKRSRGRSRAPAGAGTAVQAARRTRCQAASVCGRCTRRWRTAARRPPMRRPAFEEWRELAQLLAPVRFHQSGLVGAPELRVLEGDLAPSFALLVEER